MSDKDGAAGGCDGGGRGRGWFQPKKSTVINTPRAYVSPVAGIEHDTFNTGHSKFASQFKTSRRNVANFVQRSLLNEGYLVGRNNTSLSQRQFRKLPMNHHQQRNWLLGDQTMLRDAKMAVIGKRIVKLDNDTKKGFTIVYDQCSKAVKSRSRLKISGTSLLGIVFNLTAPSAKQSC